MLPDAHYRNKEFVFNRTLITLSFASSIPVRHGLEAFLLQQIPQITELYNMNSYHFAVFDLLRFLY